ncbi:MAG TPA: hypothetical protein PKC20_19165, partial [Burkholderiaceae bacterium]|nr:hypothetical protein [Burkholderiaceae bacterium]
MVFFGGGGGEGVSGGGALILGGDTPPEGDGVGGLGADGEAAVFVEGVGHEAALDLSHPVAVFRGVFFLTEGLGHFG